jgi:hypothetical protein
VNLLERLLAGNIVCAAGPLWATAQWPRHSLPPQQPQVNKPITESVYARSTCACGLTTCETSSMLREKLLVFLSPKTTRKSEWVTR